MSHNSKNFHYKNNRFQQLKGFCYTVQNGSISSAAKKMGLSQGAVSLQIKSLERDLGVSLFERGKNKITLTKEGKEFYQHSVPHIYGADGLFEDFIEYLRKEKSSTINLAANNVSICYILPKYLKRFEGKHPEVKFRIRNIVREDAIKKLKSNELDFLLYSMKPEEIPSELEFIPIAEYNPVLLVSKKHPLVEKKNIGITDIKPYPILRLDHKLTTLPDFDSIARSFGLRTKIEFEMANYEILKKFVIEDIGVAIISDICLEGENESRLVRKDLSKFFPKIMYGILKKKNRRIHGLAHDLIEMLATEKLLQIHKVKPQNFL